MPTLKKGLPKYRKHKATGQAVVTICGRDHYLGKFGTRTSKTKYDRLVGEWVAQGRPAVMRPTNSTSSTNMLIKELILHYWTHCQSYYVKDGKPTGEQGCVRTALKPVRELYGDTTVGDSTPMALKACRDRMIASGWCRKHINKQVVRVRQMFRWGVQEGLVPVSVQQALATVDGLKKGRTEAPEKPPIQAVDDAIVDHTLPELDETLQAMIQLQRLTGMRPQEVYLLTPGQIDRTHDVWLLIPSRHKTEHHDRNRVVPIGPRAQAILTPYLFRDSDEYCFQPSRSHRKHYTKDSYRERIWKACRRVWPAPEGCSHEERLEWERNHRWSPNQLRHSAATEIRSTFDLDAARVVLGHSKAGTTEIYADADVKRAMEVARKIG